MSNLRYQVNISYVPSQPNGMTAVDISGETYSMMTYTDEYYMACMPELNICATGSYYDNALENLIDAITQSGETQSGIEPWATTGLF